VKLKNGEGNDTAQKFNGDLGFGFLQYQLWLLVLNPKSMNTAYLTFFV